MKKSNEEEQFVLHRGALFKKNSKGLHPSPHCPHCRRPMFFQMEHTRFYCFKCGSPSQITIDTLDAALAEVAQEDQRETKAQIATSSA